MIPARFRGRWTGFGAIPSSATVRPVLDDTNEPRTNLTAAEDGISLHLQRKTRNTGRTTPWYQEVPKYVRADPDSISYKND